MKFDMHCHTKEGSPDAKITIEDYIKKLHSLGYHGMLVTDHDSYSGYMEWKAIKQYSPYKDFVVLKGIEYDTIDGGHILVVMPSERPLRILEFRGLPVRTLIELVHRNGGILGPAHPCGERHLSIMNTARYRHHPEILRKFDFIEGYNPCESDESNDKAQTYGRFFNLPCFGGSDSHKEACVGHAFTEIPAKIETTNDLISFIKNCSPEDVSFGGYRYDQTTKDKLGPFNHVLVEGFWFYNKFAAFYRKHKRKAELNYLNKIEPILSLIKKRKNKSK